MGFFESYEKFKFTKQYKYWHFGILCILCPMVIAMYASAYFGGLWDPISKLNNFKVSVVNKDIGCPESNGLCTILSLQMPEVSQINIGGIISGNLQNNEQTKNIFDWNFEDLTYDGSIQTVENYDRWGVIYIPEDFTQSILSQIQVNMTKYSTPEAKQLLVSGIMAKTNKTEIEVAGLLSSVANATSTQPYLNYIYDTARSYTAVNFVVTVFENIDKAVKKQIALTLFQQANGKASFSTEFYLNAFDSKYVDIHPLRYFGQNFVTFMLFVFSYIAAMATNLLYRKYRPFDKYILKNRTRTSVFLSVIGKACINMFYMLIVSAFMMLVIFMFGDAQHEHNLFYAYLVFVLWGFISLFYTQIISNLFSFITFLGICVVSLVLQLTTCGGIMAVPLQPDFWNIGKAFGMYYATAELKYIFFDTGGRFSGRNILALLCWTVGLAFVDAITCVVQLRNVRKRTALQTYLNVEAFVDAEKQEQTSFNKVTSQDIERNV